MRDLFRGELVCMTAEEPETRAKSEVLWQRDSEFRRLADVEPAMLFSESRIRQWSEGQSEKGFNPKRYAFSIRALKEDKLIGFLSLDLDLFHNEAWIGIVIGEREFWGRGYGTAAMRLCLYYAFTELNVHRVSLSLHAYNLRALRSYEKAGFRLEGRTRRDAQHEGIYTDGLWMGILREEWLQMQKGART